MSIEEFQKDLSLAEEAVNKAKDAFMRGLINKHVAPTVKSFCQKWKFSVMCGNGTWRCWHEPTEGLKHNWALHGEGCIGYYNEMMDDIETLRQASNLPHELEDLAEYESMLKAWDLTTDEVRRLLNDFRPVAHMLDSSFMGEDICWSTNDYNWERFPQHIKD